MAKPLYKWPGFRLATAPDEDARYAVLQKRCRSVGATSRGAACGFRCRHRHYPVVLSLSKPCGGLASASPPHLTTRSRRTASPPL